MPRDDLSIDFVKKMPQTEPLDPAVMLEEWMVRVQNLPEEVRFIQDEIRAKDRVYAECIRVAEDRDAKIQKWYKNNGSHIHNPKEDGLKAQVRENYQKAEKIAAEKTALAQRLQIIMDKHLRHLDLQLKMLYDRAEPGFTEPDDVPSLLRPSAANKAAFAISSRNPNGLSVITAVPLSSGISSAGPQTPITARSATTVRAQAAHQHAASAPVSPAATIMLNRNQRESSAGAPPKRPRLSTSATMATAPSSSLARHSSLGPSTPKPGALPITVTLTNVVRAGSAGPRGVNVKIAGATLANRKTGTPGSSAPRKKGSSSGNNPKSSLSRMRKSNKMSPASAGGESELSDADSGSDMSESEPSGIGSAVVGTMVSSGRVRAATPVDGVVMTAGEGAGHTGGVSAHLPGNGELDEDEEMGDADYDEAGDNKKYCLCQKVSFGDMVACDNDECPYEWFHWSCVGLESEPNGKWYCPVCEAKRKK